MATQIENVNIPVVQITAIAKAAQVVGSHRILQGFCFVNPIGNADLSYERERALRRAYVEKALRLLTMNIEGPNLYHLGN